jgi:hypothetical protein
MKKFLVLIIAFFLLSSSTALRVKNQTNIIGGLLGSVTGLLGLDGLVAGILGGGLLNTSSLTKILELINLLDIVRAPVNIAADVLVTVDASALLEVGDTGLLLDPVTNLLHDPLSGLPLKDLPLDQLLKVLDGATGLLGILGL